MSGPAPISNRDFAIAIVLILGAAACLGGVSLFGKQLTASLDLPGVVLLRFVMPCLILLWIVFIVHDQPIVWGHWPTHILRSVFALGAQYCFFLYLSHGSLLLATLLFLTSGLFLPFLPRLVFGMEIKKRTLLAVIVSFAGVAVILDPTSDFDAAMLIGLLSGLLNAGSQATQHRQSKQTSPLVATVVMFALCSLYCAIILALAGDWRELAAMVAEGDRPGSPLIGVALTFALLTISNQALRSRAYRYVNKPASLTPFLYAAILFSGVLDWLVYGVTPAPHVFVGVSLILIGGIVMAWRGKAPGPAPRI